MLFKTFCSLICCSPAEYLLDVKVVCSRKKCNSLQEKLYECIYRTAPKDSALFAPGYLDFRENYRSEDAPRADFGLVSAGGAWLWVLESLVAHRDGNIDERMLKLVRMAASFATACPFCIDMNSYEHESLGIHADDISALRGLVALEAVSSLSAREKLAIQYARLVSQTPLKFQPDFIEQIKSNFNEREIVILASTAAQVNYWARLIQALGIPPAGFSE